MAEQSIFIARQPIFTKQLDVFGYELLSRTSRENAYHHADPDMASREVISACLNVFSFDSLTESRKGFINVTGALLKEDLLAILPKETTVLEVLETVAPEPEILAAIEALKRSGYRIALDDFLPSPELDPLVALADIIKVDFLQTTGDERRKMVERYATNGRLLLAEKVETYEELTEAVDIGYSLFQGFFFCRPTVFERRDLPRCKLNYLRFLSELSKPALDLESIERVIKEETSLAVRLLRYLNSAQFGRRVELTSIKQALIHLGERPLRRWGSLVAIVSLGDDKPDELVVTSLTRARFCELLGQPENPGSNDLPFFLVGLFSTLDAMLDNPMEDALDEVAIAPEIRAAILGDTSHLGRVLQLVIALEQGEWTKVNQLVSSLGVADPALSRLYGESIRWVEQIFAGGLREAA